MNIQTYSELITQFKSFSALQDVEQTFLEITGYPYFENVASNILEFFFDPEREHGLDTLFIEAILDTISQEWVLGDLENVSVEREAVTQSNYRLDLIIFTETFVIGIENKLFAAVDNDFSIYKRHLEYKLGDRRLISILLSLFPVRPSPSLHGFIPITYDDFFIRLLPRIGQPLLSANHKYIPL